MVPRGIRDDTADANLMAVVGGERVDGLFIRLRGIRVETAVAQLVILDGSRVAAYAMTHGDDAGKLSVARGVFRILDELFAVEFELFVCAPRDGLLHAAEAEDFSLSSCKHFLD